MVPGVLWLTMATWPCAHRATLLLLLTLLTMAICTQALERGDPMAAVLDMPRSKAVIAFWEKDVRQIFTSYAAADMDIDAQAAQDTVNLTELMYMLTEGTPTLTLTRTPNANPYPIP